MSQAGYAPAARPPDEFRGTWLHRRLAEVGSTEVRGTWRRYRDSYFDAFRRRKLRFILSRRGAPRRVWNFLVYLLERNRVVNVHYAPVSVGIEPGNLCNLACPGCTTGQRNPAARHRRWASLAEMKERIGRVAPTAIQLQLFHWGEPLLSPAALEACEYAVECGLWTSMHSNLSLEIDGLAERVVGSRLCNLVVSCDGATQEVYEKYRVGGDVNLVFSNIAAIAAAKRARGVWHPWITAKFIVFDHNWHEVDAFRQRAHAAGADEFLLVGGLVDVVQQTGRVAAEREFDLTELRYVPRRLGHGCRELWEGMSLDHDGAIYPCCDAFRDEDVFVEPAEVASLRDAWNSPAHRRARAFFAHRSSDPPSDLPRPCDTCERVRLHAIVNRG